MNMAGEGMALKTKAENRRILVLGGGVSGMAAAAAAHEDGYDVATAADDTRLPDGDFLFAVVSPGIDARHCWFRELAGRGIPAKSELQFGCERLAADGWELYAVTGSKGKSSVVKLVAGAIGAVACGNYGVAVSSLRGRCGKAVVEVSSFMMEHTLLPRDTFKACLVLNLQSDHLDRHGDIRVYHALKRKLLDFTRCPIDASGGRKPSDDAERFFKGSYFDNAVLRQNAVSAIELMRVAGADDAAVAAAFSSFEPLPHRMQNICERGGVRYIDDSKATNLEALSAALRMCQPGSVRLIAGGTAKGDDPAGIIFDLTKQVKKVYLIGCCAEVFFQAWSGAVDCEICGTLENAVGAAKRDVIPGETVLLSPGAASFDQFKNFGERGDRFAQLVKQGR